ncbi:MAG: hypothetical protein H7A49_00755 [Akkermansiaceae bacterium]|nr:hypothetical protein [Akkermansiaceae bacterium]MCP5546053.1 hypothetical protein [Akkermansiaceae bacterium]
MKRTSMFPPPVGRRLRWACISLLVANLAMPVDAELAVGSTIEHLSLSDGRTFENVTVTSVTDEGIGIRHQDGSTRIRFELLGGDQKSDAEHLRKSFEAPPARFRPEASDLLTAISAPYWINGDAVRAPGGNQAFLERSMTSADPKVASVARKFDELAANWRAQETQIQENNRDLNTAAAAMPAQIGAMGLLGVFGDGPDLAGMAAGLEQSTGGADMQRNLNKVGEQKIARLRLGSELRSLAADLARANPAKQTVSKPPVMADLEDPGFLHVTNDSGRTLHHCLLIVRTTMRKVDAPVGEQLTAQMANQIVGYSPEFSQESSRTLSLRAELASAERGFLIHIPMIRDKETAQLPFCDPALIPSATEVRLSIWTDDFEFENAVVPGLDSLKERVLAAARADSERRAASQPGKQPSNWNRERVNLRPKIWRDPNNPLHQGTGSRMFGR